MADDASALAQLIEHDLEHLPGCNDQFFAAMWSSGRLSCGQDRSQLDSIDEVNARLVCASLERRTQLLVELPDRKAHRPSAMLATGLVLTFMRAQAVRLAGGNVLYFGSTTGIRHDLSRVRLGQESVAAYFTTMHGRGTVTGSAATYSPIPRLLCIYSPVDPVSLAIQFNPSWVAIDCGSAPDLSWLQPLLKHLAHRHIATVAWTANPLSKARGDFEEVEALEFGWPLGAVSVRHGETPSSLTEACRLLTQPLRPRRVVPCQLTGPGVEDYTGKLVQAEYALAEAWRCRRGRLTRDAALVGYKCLRLLERLPVPLDDYELEVDNHWGCQSVRSAIDGFGRFVDACASSEVGQPLETARRCLGQALDWLTVNCPPMWTGLFDLCLEDAPADHVRALVFSSAAHRDMFGHALLAHENVSQQDLSDLGAYPLCLSELSRSLLGDEGTRPGDMNAYGTEMRFAKRPCDVMIIGVPSEATLRKLAPLMALNSLEVLHYPHQAWRVQGLVAHLDRMLTPDPRKWARTLGRLSGEPRWVPDALAVSRAVRLGDIRSVQGRPIPVPGARPPEDLWLRSPVEDEILHLFVGDDGTDEVDEPPVCVAESEHASLEEPAPATDIVVTEAVQLEFVGGWQGLFGRHQRLYFVLPSGELTERYVSSAQHGNRIVYILGQRQQNLYELIISRVHSLPEIRAHINYIRNWQEEVRRAAVAYFRRGYSLDDLYAQMCANGTQLTTSYAMRLWLLGITLRPRDVDDLRRLAEILDMPFTRQCYKTIHRAGGRIHGLHIKLSKRLKAWILQNAVGHSMRDEVIDDELGLTFGDVQDALLLLVVESARVVRGLFYNAHLGTIERSDTSA